MAIRYLNITNTKILLIQRYLLNVLLKKVMLIPSKVQYKKIHFTLFFLMYFIIPAYGLQILISL